MSKHTHESEAASEDVKKDFPVALETVNRAAVHVSDKLHLAIVRSKRVGAVAADLKKLRSITETLTDLLAEIDEVAPEPEKE